MDHGHPQGVDGDEVGRVSVVGGQRDPDHALFAISVAGELTGVNPQMLRIYESRGLVAPRRTEGGTRRYSARDIDRIDRVTTLLADGLNLAGIEMVFALEAETRRLGAEIRRLRRGDPVEDGQAEDDPE